MGTVSYSTFINFKEEYSKRTIPLEFQVTSFNMFDTTFAEVLVVVTAAGLLLGRREIAQASRFTGWSIGKAMGTLQGLRMKYEQKTAGSQIYQLHKSVKEGLADIGTISQDLNTISRGGAGMNGNRNGNNTIPENQPMSMRANKVPQPQPITKKGRGGILGSNAVPLTPATATIAATSFTDNSTSNINHNYNQNQNHNHVLAKLILADDILYKERGPASMGDRPNQTRGSDDDNSNSNSSSFTNVGQGSISNEMTGSDVIEATLCESIVNQSYYSGNQR